MKLPFMLDRSSINLLRMCVVSIKLASLRSKRYVRPVLVENIKTNADSDNPMTKLRTRLFTAGISKSFLENSVLPSWWEESLAMEPGGFREIVGHISSYLGFSMSSLMNPERKLECPVSGNVKYKKKKNVDPQEITVATNIGISVARSIARSFPDEEAPEQVPAACELRERLLTGNKKEWLELNDILAASWDMGIPVVFVSNLPSATKPDALTTFIGDRPVIVVMEAQKSPSRISFTIAHELGHIHFKHLESGQTLVDESIDRSSVENEEQQANNYAKALLTGKETTNFQTGTPIKAAVLKNMALGSAKIHKINPGVVLWNYAFNTGFWGPSVNAIKAIEGSRDAAKEITKVLKSRIDEGNISSDDLEKIDSAISSRA
ncbi:MAG: ImmA/IrrE family metallo-endopeptidase [Luteolibacter sp.]